MSGVEIQKIVRLEFDTNIGCDPSLYADTGSGKKIVLKKRPNSDGIAEYEVHMGNTQAKSVPADNQLRRLLMAEFALFIHGSAIYAIMHSASVFTMPEINGWQTWWSSLLKWKDECAVCGKKLTSPSGNLQDPWKISVGMRDKRSGKYTSESRVADERHTVYLCFSRMLTSLGNGWSHGLGPVFFYFAELYHADCRFAREKERALVLFQDMMPHEEEL